MHRNDLDERIPFLMDHRENPHEIIEIESNSLPDLHQDVIDVIASHVSYTAGLAALRQASKKMDVVIEKSHAGRLARQAHDLEQANCKDFIKTGIDIFISDAANTNDGCSVMFGTAIGTLTGGLSGFSSAGVVTCAGVGTVLGTTLTLINAAYQNFGLFKENNNHELNKIRKQLNEPIALYSINR